MDVKRFGAELKFDPVMYEVVRRDSVGFDRRLRSMKLEVIEKALDSIPYSEVTSIRLTKTELDLWDHKTGPLKSVRFEVSVGRIEVKPLLVYEPITLRRLIRQWKLDFPVWKMMKIRRFKERFWWPITDPIKKLYWAVQRDVPQW